MNKPSHLIYNLQKCCEELQCISQEQDDNLVTYVSDFCESQNNMTPLLTMGREKDIKGHLQQNYPQTLNTYWR